jgi:biopolymer transport protein ExbB/TolQ
LDTLTSEVKRALGDDDDAALRKRFGGSRSMAARVALSGVSARHRGPSAVSEAMNSEKSRCRREHEQNLILLGTLGNNAPFIGLFGTVLGIIKAFHDLKENPQGGLDVVGGGVSEALVATAVGIMVAIPAVVAFNFFNRRVRAAGTGTDEIAHVVLAELHGSGAPEREPAGGAKEAA